MFKLLKYGWYEVGIKYTQKHELSLYCWLLWIVGVCQFSENTINSRQNNLIFHEHIPYLLVPALGKHKWEQIMHEYFWILN